MEKLEGEAFTDPPTLTPSVKPSTSNGNTTEDTTTQGIATSETFPTFIMNLPDPQATGTSILDWNNKLLRLKSS